MGRQINLWLSQLSTGEEDSNPYPPLPRVGAVTVGNMTHTCTHRHTHTHSGIHTGTHTQMLLGVGVSIRLGDQCVLDVIILLRVLISK